MELTVLLVPGCPTAAVLRQRLAEVLAGRADVRVAWREVGDAGEAVRLGMHGSPTLLVNGVDPFVREGEVASLSCRLPGGVPSAEQLRTVLADGRLAPEAGGQRAVQQAVLRAFARHGRPPTAAELDEAAVPFGVPAGQVLAELAAADYLSLDEGGRIRAAYPFSPTPTGHRVRIADGPQVWAMCAVDALGIAPMLGRDVEIRSADPADGREITVTFCGGGAQWQPASAVVLVSTGACSGPAVDACCSSLNFFADAASARRWARRHPQVQGRALGQEQAEALGRETFRPLLG